MGLFENSHFPYTNFHEMNLGKLVETVENAAGQAGTMADRMTAAESDINTLELRADGTDNQITLIHGRLSRAENDIDALEARATTSEGDITALTTRVTAAEGDIDALDTRITTEVNTLDTRITNEVDTLDTRITADEATIATQGTQIASKSTVDVDQILVGGVRIGTITVDGTPTILYAPTAGSTVVRAEDVPFNNSDVLPPMSAIDCQEAIEELNTNTGAVSTRVTTLEGSVTTLSGDMASAETDIDNLEANVSSHSTTLSQMHRDILSLKGDAAIAKRVWYYLENVEVGNTEYYDTIGRTIAPGHLTADGRDITCVIPYNRMIPYFLDNPVEEYSKYTITIDGGIMTARGVNGYLPGINNVPIDSYSQTTFESISIRAEKSGYYITFRLPTSLTTTNNSPVTLWFNLLQLNIVRTTA